MSTLESQPGITYTSYLLRVRCISTPGGQRTQVYLRGVQDDDGLYFNSLHELMVYLRAQSRDDLPMKP